MTKHGQIYPTATDTITLPEALAEDLRNIGLSPRDLVLYISSKCNLRCKHCYIGNELLNASRTYELSSLLKFVRSLGTLARVTVLGGEPLLYPEISRLLEGLAELPIQELRLTTNLTCRFGLISHLRPLSRPLLSVSIDGHNAATHNAIRGRGAFERTTSNITDLISQEWEIEITHTVMSHNIHDFHKMVQLCKTLGVKKLNLHRMSLHGNALRNQSLSVAPERWRKLCSAIESMTTDGDASLQVRYPPLFVTEAEYRTLIELSAYHHHSTQSFYSETPGHRVVLYPDGKIFISSEAFGTDSHLGQIQDGVFRVNTGRMNERRVFEENSDPSISLIACRQMGSARYPRVLSVSHKRVVTV